MQMELTSAGDTTRFQSHGSQYSSSPALPHHPAALSPTQSHPTGSSSRHPGAIYGENQHQCYSRRRRLDARLCSPRTSRSTRGGGRGRRRVFQRVCCRSFRGSLPSLFCQSVLVTSLHFFCFHFLSLSLSLSLPPPPRQPPPLFSPSFSCIVQSIRGHVHLIESQIFSSFSVTSRICVFQFPTGEEPRDVR